MTKFGPVAALALLAALAGAGALVALRLWPSGDPDILEHTHDNLPLDHPISRASGATRIPSSSMTSILAGAHTSEGWTCTSGR